MAAFQKVTAQNKIVGEDKIVVKGARTHNLKNITVEMPRNSMIAITGLSGSGKSSLAFDTIFAEGQRRYVESLSAYARQFLHKMQKPDVDEIARLQHLLGGLRKPRLIAIGDRQRCLARDIKAATQHHQKRNGTLPRGA